MNNHLTQPEMLAYLDGELSKADMAKAAEHLHSCWTCRIEMERLEGDIAVILDAHNESFAPALAPPPSQWPPFETVLARKQPLPAESIWLRLLSTMRTLLAPARGVLVAGAVLVGVLVIYLNLPSKTVSAKEVLQHIGTADAKRSVITPQQVIRQRVRVRRETRTQSGTQSETVDTWKSPKATVWQTSPKLPAVSALQQRYEEHHIPADLPLSAAAVDAWGRAAGGSPTVEKRGTDLSLSFVGTSDGPMDTAKVDLLVEPRTWQVKQMTLQFAEVSFEVTEEDFSIVPTSAVPPVLVAQLEPGPELPGTAVAHPLIADLGTGIRLPEVNLDQVQLDVVTKLHRLSADLGEPVTITHSSHQVEVGIWQLPPERQMAIQAALQGEPNVTVRTTAPPMRSFRGNGLQQAAGVANAEDRIVVAQEDEDQRLLKFFAGPDKEQAFTRDALDKSTAILAHLYALRNLQAQFPPEREVALAPAERAQLAAIVKDHAAAVLASLNDLQTALEPLNAAFRASAPSEVTDYAGIRWQDESLDALGIARNADHLLRSLLTTSQTPVSPDEALPQLQQQLSRLAAAMRVLRQP